MHFRGTAMIINRFCLSILAILFSVSLHATDLSTGREFDTGSRSEYVPDDGNCPTLLKKSVEDDFSDQSSFGFKFKSEAKVCQSPVRAYQDYLKSKKQNPNFSDANNLGKHFSETFKDVVHPSYQDRFLKDCGKLPPEKASAIQTRFYAASARIAAVNSPILDEVAYYDSVLPSSRSILEGVDCTPVFPENAKKCANYRTQSQGCPIDKKKRLQELVEKTNRNLGAIEALITAHGECEGKVMSGPAGVGSGRGGRTAMAKAAVKSCDAFLQAIELKKNETPWIRGEIFNKIAVKETPNRGNKFRTQYNFTEKALEKAIVEQLAANRKGLTDNYKSNLENFRCLTSNVKANGKPCDFKQIRTDLSNLPNLTQDAVAARSQKNSEAKSYLEAEACLLERGEDRAKTKDIVSDSGKGIVITVATVGLGSIASGIRAINTASKVNRVQKAIGNTLGNATPKVGRAFELAAGAANGGLTAEDLNNTYQACSKEMKILAEKSTTSAVNAENICSNSKSPLAQAREEESECIMSALLSAPGVLPFAGAIPGLVRAAKPATPAVAAVASAAPVKAAVATAAPQAKAAAAVAAKPVAVKAVANEVKEVESAVKKGAAVETKAKEAATKIDDAKPVKAADDKIADAKIDDAKPIKTAATEKTATGAEAKKVADAESAATVERTALITKKAAEAEQQVAREFEIVKKARAEAAAIADAKAAADAKRVLEAKLAAEAKVIADAQAVKASRAAREAQAQQQVAREVAAFKQAQQGNVVGDAAIVAKPVAATTPSITNSAAPTVGKKLSVTAEQAFSNPDARMALNKAEADRFREAIKSNDPPAALAASSRKPASVPTQASAPIQVKPVSNSVAAASPTPAPSSISAAAASAPPAPAKATSVQQSFGAKAEVMDVATASKAVESAWVKTEIYMKKFDLPNTPENQKKILKVYDGFLSREVTPLGPERVHRRDAGLRIVDAPSAEKLKIPEFVKSHVTVDHHNQFGKGLAPGTNSTVQVLDMLDPKSKNFISPAEFNKRFSRFASDNLGDGYAEARTVALNHQYLRDRPHLIPEVKRLTQAVDFGVFSPEINLAKDNKLAALLRINDKTLPKVQNTFMDRVSPTLNKGAVKELDDMQVSISRVLFPKTKADLDFTNGLANEFRGAVDDGLNLAKKSRVEIKHPNGNSAPIFFADVTELQSKAKGPFEAWAAIPQYTRKLENGAFGTAERLQSNFTINGSPSAPTRTLILSHFDGRKGADMLNPLPGQTKSFERGLIVAEKAAIEARIAAKELSPDALVAAEARLKLINEGKFAYQNRSDGSLLIGPTYMKADELKDAVTKNLNLLGHSPDSPQLQQIAAKNAVSKAEIALVQEKSTPLAKFVAEMAGPKNLRSQDLEFAGSLNNKDRIAATEGILNRELSQKQKAAMLKAHEIGGFRTHGQYTAADIAEKRAVMKAADFSQKESETLLWKGITGFNRTEMLPLAQKRASEFFGRQVTNAQAEAILADNEILSKAKDVRLKNLTDAGFSPVQAQEIMDQKLHRAGSVSATTASAIARPAAPAVIPAQVRQPAAVAPAAPLNFNPYLQSSKHSGSPTSEALIRLSQGGNLTETEAKMGLSTYASTNKVAGNSPAEKNYNAIKKLASVTFKDVDDIKSALSSPRLTKVERDSLTQSLEKTRGRCLALPKLAAKAGLNGSELLSSLEDGIRKACNN